MSDAQAESHGATGSLAEFAAATRYSDLPPAVAHEAKRLLLDVLGNIIGGRDTEIGEIALRYVEAAGAGGTARILGCDVRASIPLAAYANGRLGDALDAADTFLSVYHLGNPTVAAALTIADSEARSGADLLTAIAVGMEVGTRIAASVGPPSPLHRIHPERLHVRGGRMPAVELAAAAAAARTLGSDAKRMAHTLGIAGANAPLHATRWGEYQPLPLLKYADNGTCTEVGVAAALQAAVGLTAHPELLDGDRGLWRIRGAAACDFNLMLDGLGERWLFLDNTYKPWPGCRWTHYPLTLLERLRAAHPGAVDIDRIERVEVRSHVWGMSAYFGNPDPVGIASCEMNYPHAIAMALLGVPIGPAWYAKKTQTEPRVVALRRKVRVELEPRSLDLEKWYVDGQIRRLPNGLRLTVGGKTLDAEGDFAKGDPWDPETALTDDQLVSKFSQMVTSGAVGPSDPLRVADAVWNLHATSDVRSLLDVLETSRPAVGV